MLQNCKCRKMIKQYSIIAPYTLVIPAQGQSSSVNHPLRTFPSALLLIYSLTWTRPAIIIGSMLRGKRMMLKRARETNAFSASRTLSGDDRTYTAKVVRDTWRQNIERTHKKVKVWFYTTWYPARWTAQSALHFTPWHTCSFRHQLGFSGTHSSHAAILSKRYSLTFPPLSIHSQVLVYTAE